MLDWSESFIYEDVKRKLWHLMPSLTPGIQFPMLQLLAFTPIYGLTDGCGGS
jgi:hypothetical protein